VGPVSALFGPGGRLSSAHATYEFRPGQQRMAECVERTLTDGGKLLVEAGTGTGKTLAYLVPALAAGERVVISTGTRNLQDQIFDKEIPFLRDALGFNFTACVMKGRDNYLCRYRMGQFEREPLLEDLNERDWVPRIAEWGRLTETGDRAEIVELPDRLRLWRDINARSDTCDGSRCPEYELCWLTRLKKRAQQAQLVVVNHHLFFADLALRSAFGAVIPDYDMVIFDEAHQLEDVATLYFGVQVSSAEIEDLARDVERLAANHGGPASSGGGSAELRRASRELFAPLRERAAGAIGRIRLEPVERGGPDLEVEWAGLCEALDEVTRRLPSDAVGETNAESASRRVDDLREGLTQVLDRGDPAFVYGLESRGRSTLVLSASPIDVSQPLKERLFDTLHAVVLTSATLAVGGRFDFFQQRLGLDDAQTATVESAFDHRMQALLYLPRRMPEPREPEFAERAFEEVVRLLDVSDGHAFLLFTSFAQLHRMRDRLEQIDRWPLFVQGEGSKAALVERFRATPRAVLLGTASFWHGVDVPGRALSLVVLDKLPFDVPSDPLVAARIDRIREERRNPFVDYQLPMAVLQLKQGLGRLLRSTADRGLLCVLDPRVLTKRYGRVFLQSLPPYRIVREIDACVSFLAEGTGESHA
jgi:ATP-dependent DNA helicase DinG